MLDHTFQCPFCWKSTSMMLDGSVPEQTYIEDCQVCCNPLEVHVVFQNNSVWSFDVVGL